MFQIRPEQLDKLNAAAVEESHHRLLALLRRVFPASTERRSTDDLLSWIREGQSRAAKFGIVSAAGITRFVGMSLAITQFIDEVPEIRTHLCSASEESTETRLRQLLESSIQLLVDVRIA